MFAPTTPLSSALLLKEPILRLTVLQGLLPKPPLFPRRVDLSWAGIQYFMRIPLFVDSGDAYHTWNYVPATPVPLPTLREAKLICDWLVLYMEYALEQHRPLAGNAQLTDVLMLPVGPGRIVHNAWLGILTRLEQGYDNIYERDMDVWWPLVVTPFRQFRAVLVKAFFVRRRFLMKAVDLLRRRKCAQDWAPLLGEALPLPSALVYHILFHFTGVLEDSAKEVLLTMPVDLMRRRRCAEDWTPALAEVLPLPSALVYDIILNFTGVLDDSAKEVLLNM